MSAPATNGVERKSPSELLDTGNIGDYCKCYYTASEGALGEFSLLEDYTNKTEIPVVPISLAQNINYLYPLPTVFSVNGYFYLIKTAEKVLIADRIIQKKITWNQLKTAGVIDNNYNTFIGKMQIPSREYLKSLSSNTSIGSNSRNIFNCSQCSFGFGGGYGGPAKLYDFNLTDGNKTNWITLELVNNEVNTTNFNSIFDWNGQLDANHLLGLQESGGYLYYVNMIQSKALSQTYVDNTSYGSGLTYYTGFRPMFTVDSVVLLTQLSATAGDTKVILSWTAVDGATGYNVKRSTTAGGPYTTIASNVTGTSYVDTSVTNGTTYYYVVTAVTVNGESVNSNEASATPLTTVVVPTGNALLRVTMLDSSEREYRVSAAEIDGFVNWYTRTIGTGSSCYALNDIVDNSKEYLAFEKIISFKVIEIK